MKLFSDGSLFESGALYSEFFLTPAFKCLNNKKDEDTFYNCYINKYQEKSTADFIGFATIFLSANELSPYTKGIWNVVIMKVMLDTLSIIYREDKIFNSEYLIKLATSLNFAAIATETIAPQINSLHPFISGIIPPIVGELALLGMIETYNYIWGVETQD